VAADPSLQVAFFALLFDQDLGTPMQVFAMDEAASMGRVERVPQQRPRRVMSSNCRYISRLGPV